MTIMFDGITKIATLSNGTISLSVTDIWSRWVDWLTVGDNSKYLPMFTLVGGDPIDETAGTSIPFYAFLQNGWRIKPQESSHTLHVSDGVLLVSGGGDPFVDTDGAYNVRVNYSQPVQAVTVSTSGGNVTLSQIESSLVLSKEATLNAKFAQMQSILNSINIPTSSQNADAVWGKPISDMTDKTTIGGYISKVLLSVPKFLGLK
jgi:hypothetical protein